MKKILAVFGLLALLFTVSQPVNAQSVYFYQYPRTGVLVERGIPIVSPACPVCPTICPTCPRTVCPSCSVCPQPRAVCPQPQIVCPAVPVYKLTPVCPACPVVPRICPTPIVPLSPPVTGPAAPIIKQNPVRGYW